MLELKGVTFTAPKEDGAPGRTIIDQVDYTFEKGRFYAITGPNGSGKTTLAKLVMGILAADSGSILLEGKDVTGLSVSERARAGIAYGFQHSARFKGTTFRDLLSVAAGTDDEDELVKVIARVGICSYEFLDKPVDTKLSGGEIKKIELATVIARNPKVAIYDEPDTGIDLWTIEPMVDLLKREQESFGTTTIVVTHNKTFLEAADRLLLIRKGKIAYEGRLPEADSLLTDLSACNYTTICEGEENAGCYR